MRKFIGIDNGVSGSIAILKADGTLVYYGITPIHKCLSYTKKKQYINRIDGIALKSILYSYAGEKAFCLLERPMINAMRFKASMSAIRALEATLILLEDLHVSYEYVDSKEWQKVLLPSGLEKDELKQASLQVAKRLFPSAQFKDGDGLLIAEYARRKHGHREGC